MQFTQASFERPQLIGFSFQQEQRFCCGLDLTLPAVDRLDRRNHRGAGHEMLFDKRATDAGGLFGAGCRRNHDAGTRGGFGHKRLSSTVYECWGSVMVVRFWLNPGRGEARTQDAGAFWVSEVHQLADSGAVLQYGPCGLPAMSATRTGRPAHETSAEAGERR